MIPAGTLLASTPQVPVEQATSGLTVGAWDIPRQEEVQLPLGVLTKSETSGILFEVETWFDDGCRDCIHHRSKGYIFRVTPRTLLLTTSGAYFTVEMLKQGHRLRSLGCGHETVKEVRVVYCDKMPVFDLRLTCGDNYGITNGASVVLLHGNHG